MLGTVLRAFHGISSLGFANKSMTQVLYIIPRLQSRNQRCKEVSNVARLIDVVEVDWGYGSWFVPSPAPASLSTPCCSVWSLEQILWNHLGSSFNMQIPGLTPGI